MKRERRHKKILFYLVIFMTAFFVIALSASHVFAQANTETASSSDPSLTPRALELQQNISGHQDEIKKLEAEIANYQTRLIQVGTQKKTLQSAVQTLDLTRAKLATDAKLTQAKIGQTNNKIQVLSGTIDVHQSRIDKDFRLIGDMLRRIDQYDSNTLPEMLLSNLSLSDFLQEVEDMNRLQTSVRDGIASLKRMKTELGVQKSSYMSQQKNLQSLNTQLADQKKLADQKRIEQSQLLKDTKNQESNYSKQLAQTLARKKQFETEIDNFEAQLRAEIDPNSIPRPGTKVLGYPLVNPRVTQQFGKTIDSVRLYAAGTHNGVDFGEPIGTPVKAAGDGIVLGTGDTDKVCKGASFGRWVMIQHKNGLSTMYAHFELIKVSKGQQVSVGDVIGYSGNTGYSTGPHLHFGLYVTSATQIIDLPSKACTGAIFHIPVAPSNGYLDPQAYL